jgi:M6 family metalloprotease-like protein
VLGVGACLAGGYPASAAAQDVEMLGRRYGTRPPAAYYEQMARDPEAFRFRRGRVARMRTEAAARTLLRGAAPDGGAAASGSAGAGAGAPGAPLLALGPREGPVEGEFAIPVLLGLFDDSPSPPPFDMSEIDDQYFADAPLTVRRYYEEVSGGRVTLLGELRDWERASLTRIQVTDGVSGLAGSRIGDFIHELLAMQVGVPWELYDNDGPDGEPNSGDDDGYVDALAVIHPTMGAECDQADDRIWAHKWSLSAFRENSGVPGLAEFVTDRPSASGGFINVDDYFIQGVVSCDGDSLNEIGVFTHETGHAFGLPDLYDTFDGDGRHAGAGTWDLMSSGSWGCDDRAPSLPCHMGAWSKAMLGWVDVTTLPADADLGRLTLPPVETSGTVYRVDAGDGSGEYFLLENRQRGGFDQRLYQEGLLIWHVDPDVVLARWEANRVNGYDHMGVWLRQADGRDDLGRIDRPRGDAGDPFPFNEGTPSENSAFHAASNPASNSWLGTATGLTVLDVARVPGNAVELDLLTRFTTVSVRADGQQGTAGLFTVDGAPVDPSVSGYMSAPFMQHLVEAAPAEEVGPAERIPFVEWADDGGQPRSRVIVTPTADLEYVALYGGRDYRLAVEVMGGINGVEPGTIASTPASVDLWFPVGTSVTVQATPRTGFDFRAWTGALEAQPNPATVTMSAPVFAGADFQLIYAVASTSIAFPATVAQDVRLEIESGTEPVRWRLVGGELPAGMSISGEGRITGAALDLGAFPLQLEATDAVGLTATGDVTLDVRKPDIPIERLTAFFLLSGVDMDPVEMVFLDRQANGDGGYDLGDLRAWVLADLSLPLVAQSAPPTGPAPTRVVVPMGPPVARPEGAR